jgi:hypothetical protein
MSDTPPTNRCWRLWYSPSAISIGRFAAAGLDLSRDAAMYVSLGSFVVMPMGGAWGYDRYRAGRFFRQ